MRVLFVDDNEMMRKGVTSLLEAEGHEVVSFSRGQDLLHYVEEHPACDAIITDGRMPEMDGLALLRELQKIPALATVPVIMYSGDPEFRSIVEQEGGRFAQKGGPSSNLLNLLRK